MEVSINKNDPAAEGLNLTGAEFHPRPEEALPQLAAPALVTEVLPEGRARKLISQLESEEWETRRDASIELSRADNSAHISLLRQPLQSRDRMVRCSAVGALTKTRCNEAIELVAERLLKDCDWRVSLDAASALEGSTHPVALRALEQALIHSAKSEIRGRAAMSLGASKHPKAFEVLGKAALDENRDIWTRRDCLRALSFFKTPEAEKILRQFLTAKKPYLCVEAIGALAGSREPETRRQLSELTKHWHPGISRSAEDALK